MLNEENALEKIHKIVYNSKKYIAFDLKNDLLGLGVKEFRLDFTLEDYRFIVVNRKTLTPLVWEFPLTQTRGTLIDTEGNEYRDPFEIGKELRAYLDCKPPVPNGINKDGINLIKCLTLK